MNLKNFISDADAQGVLSLLDIDLIKVIDDCLLGKYECIKYYVKQQASRKIYLFEDNKKEKNWRRGASIPLPLAC